MHFVSRPLLAAFVERSRRGLGRARGTGGAPREGETWAAPGQGRAGRGPRRMGSRAVLDKQARGRLLGPALLVRTAPTAPRTHRRAGCGNSRRLIPGGGLASLFLFLHGGAGNRRRGRWPVETGERGACLWAEQRPRHRRRPRAASRDPSSCVCGSRRYPLASNTVVRMCHACPGRLTPAVLPAIGLAPLQQHCRLLRLPQPSWASALQRPRGVGSRQISESSLHATGKTHWTDLIYASIRLLMSLTLHRASETRTCDTRVFWVPGRRHHKDAVDSPCLLFPVSLNPKSASRVR